MLLPKNQVIILGTSFSHQPSPKPGKSTGFFKMFMEKRLLWKKPCMGFHCFCTLSFHSFLMDFKESSCMSCIFLHLPAASPASVSCLDSCSVSTSPPHLVGLSESLSSPAVTKHFLWRNKSQTRGDFNTFMENRIKSQAHCGAKMYEIHACFSHNMHFHDFFLKAPHPSSCVSINYIVLPPGDSSHG